VDRPEPQAEQGLREADRNERGVRLGGYDASDGKTIGSLMRLFRRFLSQSAAHGSATNDSLRPEPYCRASVLSSCGAEVGHGAERLHCRGCTPTVLQGALDPVPPQDRTRFSVSRFWSTSSSERSGGHP
jgi:hypothetical protein